MVDAGSKPTYAEKIRVLPLGLAGLFGTEFVVKIDIYIWD